ncbi:dTDP-4-dehydrorhamnose reductase [Nonomuraea dietziae]|uniref:dTDP-4-dehydrorhamnose reductase n=1 Tax=Nonomuraea dietziae TaxID=65515 RepID=UPI0033C8CBDB
MSTWMVTGSTGQLGTELVALLEAEGERVVPPGRRVLDLSDEGAVRDLVARVKPSVVVNCAAWTAVDDAEAQEERAHQVNAVGPRALALACREVGARLIHLSTDYVFSGTATTPYPEDAPTAPLNAYGRTKLSGERAVLELLPDSGYIVRTAWLYGRSGANFVKTMARLAAERETVQVVDDQHGQPTSAADLARHLLLLARSEAPPGIYHGTNAGQATWHGLAREVFTLLGADPDRVIPVATSAFPRPAPRPAYGVLGHARWAAAGLPAPRDWRAALHAAWPGLKS